MTTEARAALREAVARALWDASYPIVRWDNLTASHQDCLKEHTFKLAEAAISVALERAAKAAETPVEETCCNNPNWSGNPEDQPECCCRPEYRWGDPGEIASAIRALIKEK